MKNGLLVEMREALDELADGMAAVPPEAFNRVPFEGSWTPGELGDHLLKSYDFVLETLIADTSATDRAPGRKVKIIKEIFLNFGNKLQAPDFIYPESKKQDQQEILTGLEGTKIKITAAIDHLDLTALCTSKSLPKLGELTRLEWIYFMLYHTQRHVHQLGKMRMAES